MSAKATVELTISVPLNQPWSDKASMEDIIPTAVQEAIHSVEKMIGHCHLSISNIGKPVVKTIIKVD